MQWSLFLLILMGQWSSFTCRLYEYRYVGEKKNWIDAQRHCREHHTDLAIVNNMEDVERLQKSANLGKEDKAWIGLHSPEIHNMTWHWSLPSLECDEGGSKWGENQPNDGKGDEYCVMMLNDSLWGDFPCSEGGYSICYNGKESPPKFHLVEKKETWLHALAHCRRKHTDLVSGATQVKDAVAQLSEELQKLKSHVIIAIGLFRDSWDWSGGSNSSFRNWDQKFSDHNTTKDKCAATREDEKWESEECTTLLPFFCYKDNLILIQENKTWEDAIEYCRVNHEDLACIPDRLTQSLVQNKAKNATTEHVWLGMRYSCVVEFWFWVSDESMCYNNWNDRGKTYDCDMSGAMEVQGPDYRWASLCDETKLNFVCVQRTIR